MDLGSLLPVLLSVHVRLAISLFVPAFLLPFTLRTRDRAGEAVPAQRGRIVRVLLWLETHGTLVIGVGVTFTGLGMLLSLGATGWRPQWGSSRG